MELTKDELVAAHRSILTALVKNVNAHLECGGVRSLPATGSQYDTWVAQIERARTLRAEALKDEVSR